MFSDNLPWIASEIHSGIVSRALSAIFTQLLEELLKKHEGISETNLAGISEGVSDGNAESINKKKTL